MTIPAARRMRIVLAALLVLAGAAGLLRPDTGAAQSAGPVYVIDVHGTIDLGLAPYLARALNDAEQAGAQAVILDINTPGGRLDAVLQMREAILDSPLRTIAFVNDTAFSAGALVAISATEIYMTPAAVIGAATPVDGGGKVADEKTLSAVRSTFRATAEARGRDTRIAEAMVDPDVVIDGLSPSGSLLTLTTTEAQTWGYTNGIAADRPALLAATGLADASVVQTSPHLAERLVRVLTHPVVATILIAAGVLLLMVDLFTAGFGLIGILGLSMLGLFFWGHYLAGLAGWEGAVLVLLGLLLLGVELFILPGFGVAGVAGILALAGGLFISLLGDAIITTDALLRAGVTVTSALLLIIAGGALLFWRLPQLPGLRALVLQTNVDLPASIRTRHLLVLNDSLADDTDDEPYGRTATATRVLTGAKGAALTDLRPGGYATIDGRRVDVVTRGEYISAGEPVVLVADEGYRRIVRRAE